MFSYNSFSQGGKKMSTNHKNIIKLGTETYFVGDEFPFNISWETKIGARQSLQFGFLPRSRNYDTDKLNGIGINLAYRNYISKGRTGLQGLYISPSVRYGILNDKYEYTDYIYSPNPSLPPTITKQSVTEKVNSFAVGFTFGNQWVYKSGFTLDIGGGIGYFNNNTSTNRVITNNNYYFNRRDESGITPNLTIKFGYAF